MAEADHLPGPGGARVPAAPSNLAIRIVSALVLAPLAVVTAYVGDWPFVLFWGVAAIAVLWEWTTLVAGPDHRLMVSACGSAIAVAALVTCIGRPVAAILLIGLGVLASLIFAPRHRRLWVSGGVGYAGVMLMAPAILRADDVHGFMAIGLLFAVVWTTDVVGYFAGRAFGGPKLAPLISPKKTWSGAIAGTLGAVVVAVGVVCFWGGYNRIAIALVALVLSVVAQLGDLMESRIKRQFGAKDASTLIPGHGGVMDRLDGFWAAALIGCLIGLARGGLDGAARGLLLW
jgi:phosphatidate cytidylyltransferase